MRRGELDLHPKFGAEESFKARYQVLPSGCWEWIGVKDGYGYGIIHVDGKAIRTHRFSYELSKGPIPDGMVIMHSCDNPPCVNPAHLTIGTRGDNNRDSVSKGRNARGEDCHISKLSNDDVKAIPLLAKKYTHKEIATRLGVSRTAISYHVQKARRAE